MREKLNLKVFSEEQIGNDINILSERSPGLQAAVETQQVAMCVTVKIQQAGDQCWQTAKLIHLQEEK